MPRSAAISLLPSPRATSQHLELASGERGLSLLVRAGQLVQRVERRREVVGAADRTREVDQAIVHAVTGGAEHPCEHTVVAGLIGAEGNEVQPVFPHGSVRYAAAEDL